MRAVRAFTLLELASVIGALGVLALIALPGVDRLIATSKASEARTGIELIAHAERMHHKDTGAFVACGPTPSEVPAGTTATFDVTGAHACWQALGIELKGPVRYSYEVALVDDGFEVIARGDLDGDGVHARYRMNGRTLAVTIEGRLE